MQELYIINTVNDVEEKHLIELSSDIQYNISKNLMELSDLDTLCTDWSNTIKIPMTAANMKLFGYWGGVQRSISADKQSDVYTGVYFSPYNAIPYELYEDGNLILKGTMQFTKCYYNSNDRSYEVILNGSWNELLNSLKTKTGNALLSECIGTDSHLNAIEQYEYITKDILTNSDISDASKLYSPFLPNANWYSDWSNNTFKTPNGTTEVESDRDVNVYEAQELRMDKMPVMWSCYKIFAMLEKKYGILLDPMWFNYENPYLRQLMYVEANSNNYTNDQSNSKISLTYVSSDNQETIDSQTKISLYKDNAYLKYRNYNQLSSLAGSPKIYPTISYDDKTGVSSENTPMYYTANDIVNVGEGVYSRYENISPSLRGQMDSIQILKVSGVNNISTKDIVFNHLKLKMPLPSLQYNTNIYNEEMQMPTISTFPDGFDFNKMSTIPEKYGVFRSIIMSEDADYTFDVNETVRPTGKVKARFFATRTYPSGSQLKTERCGLSYNSTDNYWNITRYSTNYDTQIQDIDADKSFTVKLKDASDNEVYRLHIILSTVTPEYNGYTSEMGMAVWQGQDTTAKQSYDAQTKFFDTDSNVVLELNISNTNGSITIPIELDTTTTRRRCNVTKGSCYVEAFMDNVTPINDETYQLPDDDGIGYQISINWKNWNSIFKYNTYDYPSFHEVRLYDNSYSNSVTNYYDKLGNKSSYNYVWSCIMNLWANADSEFDISIGLNGESPKAYNFNVYNFLMNYLKYFNLKLTTYKGKPFICTNETLLSLYSDIAVEPVIDYSTIEILPNIVDSTSIWLSTADSENIYNEKTNNIIGYNYGDYKTKSFNIFTTNEDKTIESNISPTISTTNIYNNMVMGVNADGQYVITNKVGDSVLLDNIALLNSDGEMVDENTFAFIGETYSVPCHHGHYSISDYSQAIHSEYSYYKIDATDSEIYKSVDNLKLMTLSQFTSDSFNADINYKNSPVIFYENTTGIYSSNIKKVAVKDVCYSYLDDLYKYDAKKINCKAFVDLTRFSFGKLVNIFGTDYMVTNITNYTNKNTLCNLELVEVNDITKYKLYDYTKAVSSNTVLGKNITVKKGDIFYISKYTAGDEESVTAYNSETFKLLDYNVYNIMGYKKEMAKFKVADDAVAGVYLTRIGTTLFMINVI